MEGRLKAVALHPNENIMTGGLQDYYTDRYINQRLDRWISLDKFWSLTYDYVEHLLEKSAAAAAKDKETIEKLEKDLKGAQ